MSHRKLHVVAVIANPIGWTSRIALARLALLDWLSEPNVEVHLVECAYGSRTHDLADLADHSRVHHIAVRATSLVWNKESLINLGVSRLPEDAEYIATLDADIQFRRKGWALQTIRALDLYPVVQPWDKCYDLGPNDEHIATHSSFASVYHSGAPVVPTGAKFWQSDAGPYVYPHSGFAWAWKRDALDKVGGLIDVGGMGSGDHHMALALVGRVDRSVPSTVHPNYMDALNRWQSRANTHICGKVGFVHGTIEHLFHGRKGNRGYVSRWDMFIKHDFDPIADLKRNTFGVIEFAGNKPGLEREFDRYMRSREEDVNTLT